MVEFQGVGQNFAKLEETAPQACKQILKKLRKLRDSTTFSFGELKNAFMFQTEAEQLENL